jgi:glycosyltransferase involved in cell wall biosynthesis
LEYLKIVLPLLIANCQNDEEIIVIDGGSTDGTNPYLQNLYSGKKITHFLSEKDFGESHGINKGLLMANGEIIKIVTDDDLFHFPTISFAKENMLQDKTIDVIGFDGFGFDLHSQTFNKRNVWQTYLEWKNNKKPFVFSGLSLMIRKSSLAYLGLFNTTQVAVDFEYTLRLTALSKINFKWIKNFSFINIANSNSNSNKYHKAVYLDNVSNIFYYQFREKIKYTIKRNIVFAFTHFIKREDKKEMIQLDIDKLDVKSTYEYLNQYLYQIPQTYQWL